MARAARAIVPAAIIADFGLRRSPALVLLVEDEPAVVAVEDPDAPVLEPEPELPLALEEAVTAGAGVVPLGLTLKEELLTKTWVILELLTNCRM